MFWLGAVIGGLIGIALSVFFLQPKRWYQIGYKVCMNLVNEALDKSLKEIDSMNTKTRRDAENDDNT